MVQNGSIRCKMLYTIDLPNPIHGFSGGNAEEGEGVNILTNGLITDNDGEAFYASLQSASASFLRPLFEKGILPSQINHFLVLVKDLKATVYVNELQMLVETIARRNLQSGEPVTDADMIGVSRLSFG